MTTKPTHTPERWSRNIPPARKYPVVYAGRNTHIAIVSSQGLPDEQVEANCNLIVAAPAMLKALKSLRDELATLEATLSNRALAALADADITIAEATGGTP